MGARAAVEGGVLALLGRRPGDNAQVETLAAATGLPWRALRLEFRKGLEALPNLRRGGSLYSLTAETQERLRAARPSLVIAAGKRSAPAALWLKAVVGARLVHLGRTWAPGEWFDLVVTTPQYGQPAGPNVVEILFPLTPSATEAHEPAELSALPHPRLMATLGGSAPGLALGAPEARRFADAALDRLARHGGVLLAATSPRSSVPAVTAFRRALELSGAPHRLSVFGQGPNRYRDFLASADAAIVTGDSVSMVADAAAAGCAVEVFALPTTRPRRAWPQPLALLANMATPALARRGLVAFPHDIAAYMARLASEGWLDKGRAALRMAAERDSVARRSRLLAEDAPQMRAVADAHAF